MEFNYYKLVFTNPVDDTKRILKALGDFGAGQQGEYTNCSFSITGTGSFLPLDEANPTYGQRHVINEVEEDRIEILVEKLKLKETVQFLMKEHVYDEPVVDIYPILIGQELL